MTPRGRIFRLSFVLSLAALSLSLAAPPSRSEPPDFDRAQRVSREAIGHSLGDYVLKDRSRREVRFSDYRGKPLVVNFVYTGCFQACPTATRFLSKSVASARSALGADEFNVLTIGFNQPFDNPEAMAAFARQNAIADPRWEFLSADEKTMDEVTRDFGFTYYRTPKGFDHLMQVTIVDGEGAIYRQIYGDTFDLPMLVGPLKELLSGQAVRSGGFDGLWQKVKLFCTVYDPYGDGYRANYSLFIELFAGLTFIVSVLWWLIRERRGASRF